MSAPTLRTAPTADLSAGELEAARTLLATVYEEAQDGSDWEHCLGGTHILLYRDGQLIGHTAVVLRRLLHDGHALRTGYVEGVAVRADERGHGHGATLLAEAERLIRGGYEVGALCSTEMALPFYAARGWQLWQGPTSALTPDGVERTPDEDDAVHVLPVTAKLDLTGALTCDWRGGELW
ncbi:MULTISPECIES: GNAT family N-acetyltransferase [Streptomyces]|uniref:GNAT family N-acetyltransferase n=1 Tax=Streptomyces TaxID=1883 RepID=UPI000CD5612D|nr:MULTISPECIES: GNAT family N-acetyltransferase [Streptomyces]